ncbi:MAG: hypothetical protein KGZ30_04625 [Anaplasmataceae bacterium]|nr:hypothetical protein [Anaplasmataceae bacterium]
MFSANSETTKKIKLPELLRRSLRTLLYPRQSFRDISSEEEVDHKKVTPFVIAWGGIFITLNFGIAQGASLFQFGHFLVTIPSIAIYSYLLWQLGSLSFYLLAKLLEKDLVFHKAEIAAFYLWFVWAIMPFFDLPHLLFNIPFLFIWGIGAHLSWLFAFPWLAILTYFLLKELLQIHRQSEFILITAIATLLPFFGRFFVEQIPFWIDQLVAQAWGQGSSPGFHLASLLVVSLTLIWFLLIRKDFIDKKVIKLSFYRGVFLSLGIFFVWIQLVPFNQFFKTNWIPPELVENIFFDRVGEGDSRYTHSYTWSSSDLETGTITHGPQAASTTFVDYYTGSLDFDFNPTTHEINSFSFTIHFTSNTFDGDNTLGIYGPFAEVCIKGSAASTYYCSDDITNLHGSSTQTFTINRGSIYTFVTSTSPGVATSTAAWTELVNNLAQDDNDLAVKSYTRGSSDINMSGGGDVIEFDVVTASVNYRDAGELQTYITSSTVTASTTVFGSATVALSIPSSSLPTGTYMVFYGAQLAQTTSTTSTGQQYYVYGGLHKISSSFTEVGANFPYLSSSTDPRHGDAVSGFWFGNLQGNERLHLVYRAHTPGNIAYIGERYLMALRLDGTLTENTNYWFVGPNETATAQVVDVPTSTWTTVVSTTQTFDASSTKEYLLFGYTEINSSGPTNGCDVRMTVSGNEVGGTDQNFNVSDNGFIWYNYAQMYSPNIASGSQAVELQIRSTVGNFCDARRGRLAIVKAEDFSQLVTDEITSPGFDIGTSGWFDGTTNATLTLNTVQNVIVLQSAKLTSVTTTRSALHRVSSTGSFFTPGLNVQNTSGSSVLDSYWSKITGGIWESVTTATWNFRTQYQGYPPNPFGYTDGSMAIWPVKLGRHLTQSGYRWYENNNGTSTGAALATTSTAATAPVKGTPFRLKLLLHNRSSTLPAKSQPFKLQFAQRSSTCDTAFSGETYIDVERTTGTIRLYNNTTPVDAAQITTSSTDPTNGTSTVTAQSYEEANSFVATASTTAGNSAMWDFSLVDNSATASSSFCFRVVKIDGLTLDTYSHIPEIRTVGTAPVVGSITLNNSANITLIPATTTRVYASTTVSDADGAGDILYATSTFYRSGVGTSCSHNNQNCYQVASSSCSFAGSTTTVSCYADIAYNAQATGNASSSFPAEKWQAAITVVDRQSLSNSSSSSANIHVGIITAIDSATSSINYGTITAGQNSGSSTQRLNVINYGNSSTTLRVSGGNLTYNSYSISVENQHYASSTFSYGGLEQPLSTTPTTISGVTILPSPHAPSSTLEGDITIRPFESAYEINNSYLYSLGGNTTSGLPIVFNSVTSTALYAPISSTGTIGSWSELTALPSPRALGGSAIYNNYFYLAGGFIDDSFNSTTSVLFASINSSGTLNSWTTTTALPSSTFGFSLIPYNGYMYVLGGNQPGSVATTTVLYAPINATGSLGAWTTTTAFPSAKSTNNTAFAFNGYMYQLGNMNNYNLFTGTATTTSLFAPINANGTIGSWSTTTPTVSVCGFGICPVIQSGKKVYIFRGSSGLGIDVSDILSNGHLSSWSRLPSSTFATSSAADAVVLNSYVYIKGGTHSNLTGTRAMQRLKIADTDTYWGLNVPTGNPSGTYTGTVTFTSVFSP